MDRGQVAAFSLRLASSRRPVMATAPSAPSTAISAPGQAKSRVAAEGLGTHNDVGTAVSLTENHGHQRHRGIGIGPDELSAAADNAGLLLLGSGAVSRHVHEGHHGHVKGVAELHEAPRFL